MSETKKRKVHPPEFKAKVGTVEALRRQCVLAGMCRATLYVRQKPRAPVQDDEFLKRLIDEEYRLGVGWRKKQGFTHDEFSQASLFVDASVKAGQRVLKLMQNRTTVRFVYLFQTMPPGQIPPTPVGALAEVMPMSKSGVFVHFGSREELQISVVRHYHARLEDEVFVPALPGIALNFQIRHTGVYPLSPSPKSPCV